MKKNICHISNTAIRLFIVSFVIMSQSSIDIYLASLPILIDTFHSDIKHLQLSVSLFLIGCATVQLIYGPLSDRLGRRPILIFGVSLYALSTLVCLFSQSVIVFLVGRFFQGAGISAASVLSRAIARDVFSGKALAKMMTYIAIAWSLVPMLAPLVGSYIQHYSHWRYQFVFLEGMATLLLFYIYYYLPETKPSREIQLFNFQNMLQNYYTLVTHRIYMGYTLCATSLFAVFVAFNVLSPFLFQVYFKLTAIQYGWVTLFIATGYLLGSLLNSKWLTRYSMQQMMYTGFIIFFVMDFLLTIYLLLTLHSLILLAIIMFCIMVAIGFIYANSIAGSLILFPHIAGSASALYGFLVLSGSAGIAAILSHFAIDIQSLTQVMLLLSSAAFIFMVIAQLKFKNKIILEEVMSESSRH